MSDHARARLEAEAAELYPLVDSAYDKAEAHNWGQLRVQVAHVRAKTVSPEKLRSAARVMHEMTVDTPWGECALETQADLRVQRAAFTAAGFYVEGDDDE